MRGGGGGGEGTILAVWSLTSCHLSGLGTLPRTYLTTAGPEMMSTSHCGHFGFPNIEENHYRRRSTEACLCVQISLLSQGGKAPEHSC